MNSPALETPALRAWLAGGGLALLVLPWLNAYTAGPTPNTWPWLISAFCALTLWGLRCRLTVKMIAAAWLLAAALSAVIALLQYFGLAQVLSPWVSQTPLGEAFANLRQRNQLATLLNIGLLALLWFAAQRRLRPHVWWLLVLLAFGNAASASRTGLLQLVMAMALVIWWQGAGRAGQAGLWRLCLAALAAYAVAAFSLPWLLEQFTGQAGSNALTRLAQGDALCTSRLTLWSNVLALIGQKPWLGWGWGELDYAHFITLYPGARFCDILDNAHNLPLHLAVELGVPAALALCGALAWLVWRARPWRETEPARQMAWGVLAVIALHSLLEYPLWYGPFQMAAGLCVLMLWRGNSNSNSNSNSIGIGIGIGIGNVAPACQRARPPRLPGQRAHALAAGFFMAAIAIAIAYAAWDYHRIGQIYLLPAARDAAYRDDTLDKIRGSRLFGDQVRFAELSLTPLTRETAQWTFDTARQLLHYSPEPRVIEKLIESAVMLGRDDEALAYLVRYRAAFASEHARWAKENAAR